MKLTNRHKIAAAIIALVAFSAPSLVNAAFTSNPWLDNGGGYLYTNLAQGFNILINGVNRYLNFGTFSGAGGYGIRDNAGTIEVKNSGGAWSPVGTGAGSGGGDFGVTTNIYGQSSLTPTTTQNLAINGTGTSTFVGGLEVWRQIATPYIIASSTTNASFICNDAGVLNALCFPGADIGAKINAAYAAGLSTGVEVFVPGGTYTDTTPIVAGTDGKPLELVCPVGGGHFDNAGTVINFTASSGKAITFNTNNFVIAGSGIENCSFIGPAGSGNIGSISTSTSAVFAGGTHGAFGLHLDNFHASGFGTGVEIGSNVSFLNITNSVINKNARQIVSAQVSGANGENMRVSKTILADGNNNLFGESVARYCVDIQLSGNVQWTFDGVSFDDCQLYSEQSGGTSNIIHVTNSHFEDPNTSIAAYDYFSGLSNQPAFTLVSTGNDYMQDFTSGARSQFVLNGGNFVSQGDIVDLNNNVTTPMANFVTNQDNSKTDTVSWTGLTQGFANTGASAAITNVYTSGSVSVPYSPQGLGSGLNIGPSLVVGAFTSTQNGTTTIANLGGIYNAITFCNGSTDIGVCVNNAYAAAADHKGITINIPNGKYSYSTPIVFGRDGERGLLQGSPAEGVELDYTGIGCAITINDGDQGVGIDHTSGNGIRDIYFRGSNYSTTSPQVGVCVGGTQGTDGAVLQNVNIFHFGYGLQIMANAYHFKWENGTIRDNGQNVHINAASNSGESLDFVNAFIVDGANKDAIDCFWMDNSATASLFYSGGSLDDCQMHVLQANNVTIIGTHFENPGSKTNGWGAYTYIVLDNNPATNLSVTGSTFFDTSANGFNPPNYISTGGNVTLTGVISRQFSGSTMTNFAAITGSGRITWTGLNDVSGTAFTNVVAGYPYTTNGTTGTTNFVSLGIGTSTQSGTGMAPSGNLVVTGVVTIGSSTPLQQYPNNLLNISGNTNGYVGSTCINRNAGTTASCDWLLNNEISATVGGVTSYIGDLGINANANTSGGFLGDPNGIYLYSSDGSLSIESASTTNTNAYLRFGTGGIEALRILNPGDGASVGAIKIATTTAGCLNTSATGILYSATCSSGGASFGNSWSLTTGLFGASVLTPTTTIPIYVPSIGTSTIANHEGILEATDAAGADIGAKLNTLYAGLYTTHAVAHIARGTYSFNTEIVENTSGKTLSLDCDPGTTLKWTGSATSTFFDWGQTNGAGSYINNCKFVGTGAQNGQIALELGKTNGVRNFTLNNVEISGFGSTSAVVAGSNAYLLNFNDDFVHDNGKAFMDIGSSNFGEAITFNGGVWGDCQGSTIACVDTGTGAEDFEFNNTSLDNGQLNIGATTRRVTLTAINIESSAGDAGVNYVPLVIQNSANTNVVMTGVSFVQGTNTQCPSQAISNGGNLTLNGVTAEDYAGCHLANFITNTGNGWAKVYSITKQDSAYTSLWNSTGGTGTLQLAMEDNGLLGLNTAATLGQLQIKQTADTSSNGITITNNAVAASARFWDDATGNARLEGNSAGSASILLNGSGGTGNVAISTSTGGNYRLQIFADTKPQLALSAGAGLAQWTLRNAGGNLYFSTTTVAGTATTSVSALSINGTTGNIGVNNDSPATKLDIKQNVDTSAGGFRVVDTTGNNSTRFWADAFGGHVSGGLSDTLNIIINGSGAGFVGIGTTTPSAKFVSVAASTTAGTTQTAYTGVVSIIAGLENTNVKLFETIDQWGGITASGDAPTLTACTGGSVNSNSNQRAGAITIGTGLTSCGVLFAHPYASGSTVHVFLNEDSGTLIGFGAQSVSTTGFTIAAASVATGDVVSYTVIATQ